jgi:LEA14-like dessication related protein
MALLFWIYYCWLTIIGTRYTYATTIMTMTAPISITRLFILCLLLQVSACAELTRHADAIKPTAQVTGTRLANIDFDKVELIFDLAVENNNPVALDLAGLEYDLKIADQSLVSGVTGQAVKLKANATSPVELPVTLKFEQLKKLPGEIWQKDSVAYQLDTKVKVSLPVIGDYSIPVSRQGELPVPRMPEVKIRNVKVVDLGFTSADILARVEIINPNGFDLGISDLNYRLNIDEQKWGQGSIRQMKSIPKKGRGTIDIPVNLDLSAMGSTALKLLQDKSTLKYQLKGDVTLDTGIELMRNYEMPLDIKGTTPLL